MTKRALVIRTAGDPALAGAIVDGLTANIVVDPETAEKAAKYDMSRKRDSESFNEKITSARRTYRFKRSGKLAALWACVYMSIYRALGGDVD